MVLFSQPFPTHSSFPQAGEGNVPEMGGISPLAPPHQPQGQPCPQGRGCSQPVLEMGHYLQVCSPWGPKQQGILQDWETVLLRFKENNIYILERGKRICPLSKAKEIRLGASILQLEETAAVSVPLSQQHGCRDAPKSCKDGRLQQQAPAPSLGSGSHHPAGSGLLPLLSWVSKPGGLGLMPA